MHKKDICMALVVVIAWGLNFIAINMGLREMPPLLLGALRFFMATVPAIFFLPRPSVSWSWLIALGLSINVGQFAFLFMSMKVGMPAGLASLLLQAQAFFTLVFAVLWFGQRWHFNNIAGLLLAFSGIVLIGLQQGGSMTQLGFCLIIAAAASWGMGNVVMRRITIDFPAIPTLSLVVWAGAVAILPLTLLSYFLEGVEEWAAAFEHFSLTSVGAITYLSYVATLIGYGLWGKLLSRYAAPDVAPWALLVPVVGMSSSALFLGETLSLWQSAGALLVMIGLLVHVLGGRENIFTGSKKRETK